MGENPKISVVMSVYNEPAEWMRQAIDSILNQTFMDFEFIIINDNPTRIENMHILKDYASIDSRIVVISNDQNMGLTKSLNIGIKVARGEFIARMDADDISLPERFAKQVDFFGKHTNLKVIGAQIELIDEDGLTIGKRKNPIKDGEVDVQAVFMTPICHPVAMFVKTYNNKIVEYDESFKYSQDFELWSRFGQGERGNIDTILLKYRISKNQITSKRIKEQLAFANVIQIRNLQRCGIVTSDDFWVVFNLLFYHTRSKDVTSDDINVFIKDLIDKLSIYYGRGDVAKFIMNMYASYLRKNCSLLESISSLIETSAYINRYSLSLLIKLAYYQSRRLLFNR